MIVIHHNDMDGRCAAAIVNMAVQNSNAADEVVQFLEMDYAKELPLDMVKPGDQVVIVDFSLKPDVMAKVLEITPYVTWIDHHASAAAYDYGRELDGVRDFAPKTTKSGALLTWEWFFRGVPVPYVVELVSDFDTWTHAKVPDCLQLVEAMRLRDQSPTSPEWVSLIKHPSYVLEICEAGEALIQYRDSYCCDIYKGYAFKAQIVGHPELTCLAMNLYRFGSLAFGEQMGNFDVCCAFIFDGKKWTISFYSNTKDVGAIAKEFGGGGHKGASGCVTDDLKKVLVAI